MFDKFVLWFSRTWALWCLVFGLVFLAAPIKAYQVSFEAITGKAFWAALANDMDVGGAVEKQAEQIMELVPVDELEGLEPMLGESRTKELVGEAQQIRDGVADEVGTATSQSINKVVGESVPRFLMGEDLTGNKLSQDLMLDLRPVRQDLEAWLTKAGRLIVDAVAEAIQTEIKAFMAPAISELAEGQEAAGLHTRLMTLENSFTLVATTMQGVGKLVAHLERLGVVEDKESAAAAQRLTTTVEMLARMGVTAVDQGRKVLDAATVGDGPPDWGIVVDEVTNAMVEDSVRSAKAQSDIFAKDLTDTIIGNGTYTLPPTARRVLVEQLRPAQLVLAPTVTAGSALNTLLLATLWSMTLLMVLVAGRVRRAAFWLGGTGLAVGALSSAFALGMDKASMALAGGLGAMGEAVSSAGDFIARMLSWCWGVLRFILDIEKTEFKAIEGWTKEDVLNSATYEVIQRDVIGRLDNWGETVMLLSVIGLLVWGAFLLAELVARSRPAAPAGTLTAVLQQPGGTHIEDPMLFLIPKRGDAVDGVLPHASPSRILARGVLMDTAWLLVASLATFAMCGLIMLSVLGPAGGGAVVIASSAITAALVVIPTFMIARVALSGGRTFSGALCGEQIIDHTGQSQPWRLRSLLAQLPWILALAAGFGVLVITDSAMLGLGILLGLLVLAELMSIVLTDGRRTLGAQFMGRWNAVSNCHINDESRIRLATVLTHAGTVWNVLWGILWVAFFGLGLYALITGAVGVFLWVRSKDGPPGELRVRLLAYLRLGNWLSMDPVGMAIGVATLWLLQSDAARAHFDPDTPAITAEE